MTQARRLPRAAVTLLVAAAAACATTPRGPAGMPEQGFSTTSPSGLVEVQVNLLDLAGTAGYPAGRRPYYRVLHGAAGSRVEVMPWSPLGIIRQDADLGTGLTFVAEKTRPVRESYGLPRGKRRQYDNQGRERVLTFRSPAGPRLDLELRVFDDGFGFRYRFPEVDPRLFTVTAEASGFRLPAGSRAFMSAHDQGGSLGGRRAAPTHQAPWLQNLPAGTTSPSAGGWSFPALFRTPTNHHLLVTEAGLDGSYCGTHLEERADHLVYRVAFPHPSEAPGPAAPSAPSSSLPWATPWRVVIVGDRLATIVESSLVTDLAAPSAIGDTAWVRPGRASWSWWSDDRSPRSYARLAAFVDLAASMRWEYSQVDAGWPAMQGGSWNDLLRHATTRKVGLFFRYEAGISPDSRQGLPLVDSARRRQELDRLATAGARGIKVDLFESDKQAVIQLYLAILEDAARRHLLVDFHGGTVPRGWERTYPNLITSEGVRGAEMYRVDPAFAEYAPAHNTVLVFTRNVVGPMDYGPVTFSRPRFGRRTTWGHELALAVVFESGLQHFADSVEGYLAIPEEARAFLRAVPVAWDETRLFTGAPGEHAVVARRSGRTWYVGGINGEAAPRRVTIPMEFLGNGTFDMTILADGRSEASFLLTNRQRNGTDTQAVELLPYGGFAMRLSPLD